MCLPRAFWSDPFNVPFLMAVGATTLLFTGAGALLRGRQGLRKLALWSSGIALGLLVVAIAAAILTWILLNGTNPIHFTAPAGQPKPA